MPSLKVVSKVHIAGTPNVAPLLVSNSVLGPINLADPWFSLRASRWRVFPVHL